MMRCSPGRGSQTIFRSLEPRSVFTSIPRTEEKEAVEVKTGHPTILRTLYGDETRGGKFLIMPNEDPDHRGFRLI